MCGDPSDVIAEALSPSSLLAVLPLWQNYYPRSCRKMGQLLCKRRGAVHNDITSNCITFLRARTNPPRVSEVIVRGIDVTACAGDRSCDIYPIVLSV